MGHGAEYCIQTVDHMVGYGNAERGPIPHPLFSNYPALEEQSIDHVNVHHLDVDCIKDDTYHPNKAVIYGIG